MKAGSVFSGGASFCTNRWPMPRCATTCTLCLCVDIHRHLSGGPRTVELNEIDALPRAEDQLAVAIGPRKRRADEQREKMRIGVSFAVREADLRNERAQRFRQVRGNVGIGVLIDGDGA